jgi:hypothetical protein
MRWPKSCTRISPRQHWRKARGRCFAPLGTVAAADRGSLTAIETCDLRPSRPKQSPLSSTPRNALGGVMGWTGIRPEFVPIAGYASSSNCTGRKPKSPMSGYGNRRHADRLHQGAGQSWRRPPCYPCCPERR